MRGLTGLLVVALSASMMTGCSNKNTEDTKVSETPVVTITPNEDMSSNLGAWGRAMGSVLIYINDGDPYYFGGYQESEENQKAAQNILETTWSITDRQALIQKTMELVQTGDRAAYRKEAKGMNKMSDKELKKAMKQLSGSLLTNYELTQSIWSTWESKGLLAWDMCRVSHMVQWGYTAGYISVEEAQALIEPAVSKLHDNFTSWEEVQNNWLDGYALYASIDESQEGNMYAQRQKVFQQIVKDQATKGILYDDSLFQKEITPLQLTYKSLWQEVKDQDKTDKENKKSKKGK